MQGVAHDIFGFIQRYLEEEEYIQNTSHFLKDLEHVGVMLTKRVVMEESKLYRLYHEI